MALDIPSVRRQFPIFTNRPDLAYLDSAATAQKPRAVMDAMDAFYEKANANVHRGMHGLAEEATDAYEGARETVRGFLNAPSREEIVFTKNATEGINLVARCMEAELKEGDAVVLSVLEHHSNIVPWMQIKERKKIDVLWTGIDDAGRLKADELDAHLGKGNVKMVALTGQGNVLGTRPDLPPIIRKSHAAGAKVLVDAAQLLAHDVVDVQKLDCDFLVCSSHKLYGPTGIGVLYGKKTHLETMPAFLGGGMMIREVTADGFSPADLPHKFEAGTPPVAEAIGFAAAITWLSRFSLEDRKHHERALLDAALSMLGSLEGISILGPKNADGISGVISFTADGIHPHDLTDILGKKGFCLRAGHHCAQPLHAHFGIPASTRLSVGIYNTVEEIERLGHAIEGVLRKFRS